MLKSFKLLGTVMLLTASVLGAVAQNTTYKDVLLDGKPAKLNVQTGEVVLLKDFDKSKIAMTKAPDEIKMHKTSDSVPTMSTDTLKTAASTATSSKGNASNKTSSTLAPEVEKATTMVYDLSKAAPVPTNDSNYHIVQKDETLYALSKRYQVSLEALKNANNLDSTLIKVGQELRVRNLDDITYPKVWIVSKGDTLYSIARKTNTTVDAIKTLNGLTSNLIKIGQKLRLQ